MAIDYSSCDATTALGGVAKGDEAARARLMSIVREELTKIARGYMAGERKNHTLQPTALVNEVYIKLFDQTNPPEFKDRKHFMVIAARAIRRILIDYSRRHNTVIRGGGLTIERLEGSPEWFGKDSDLIEEVDRALKELAVEHERAAAVVELKFFGGFPEADIAEKLEVHVRSVERDWAFAKAWLGRRLKERAQ